MQGEGSRRGSKHRTHSGYTTGRNIVLRPLDTHTSSNNTFICCKMCYHQDLKYWSVTDWFCGTRFLRALSMTSQYLSLVLQPRHFRFRFFKLLLLLFLGFPVEPGRQFLVHGFLLHARVQLVLRGWVKSAYEWIMGEVRWALTVIMHSRWEQNEGGLLHATYKSP